MVKVTIRRIGNSLGIIVPKPMLDAWGVGEGGHLQLTERGIQPVAHALSHKVLDEHKRRLAAAVAARFTAEHIRAQSLANLHHWKKSGAWVSAYEEWEKILKDANDGELFAALLGRDENSKRLRQSPPYVGLLPREEVRKLNEEATA
jgi:antitoxin component of MazEF toxin-antitoxin module